MHEKVNEHFANIRRSENPLERKEGSQGRIKVTVWYAPAIDRMIGTLYYDEQIVTGESCHNLLNMLFLPTLP